MWRNFRIRRSGDWDAGTEAGRSLMVRFPESEGALEPRITGTGGEIKTPVGEAAGAWLFPGFRVVSQRCVPGGAGIG
jgi:hypothetical protein